MVDKGQRFGPYVAQRRLGAGGMAEAWMAVRDDGSGFEHRVCLKFIHDSFRNDTEFVELFMNEAAIAALLRHSNIVGVIDASPADGYMALELVDGCDLRAILHEAPQRRLPPALVIHIACHLCEALQYAHTRTKAGEFHGIVHRDLSPGNVLISYAGEVKLTDFGIAKAMRATGDVGSSVKGKFSYMSPEQATGEAIDGRSDLFSLGTMLYELLAGQRPFDGNTDLDTLRRVAEADHVPLSQVAPEVPAGLADTVEQLLRRDPEERPASAAALLGLLGRFAPPPTVCFDLGRVAQATRPHETLTVPGALADIVAVAATNTEREDDDSGPPTLTTKAAEAGATAVARTAEPATVQTTGVVLPRRGRAGVVAALGAIAAVAIVVGTMLLRPTEQAASVVLPAASAPAKEPETDGDAPRKPAMASTPEAPEVEVKEPARQPSPTTAAAPATDATDDAEPGKAAPASERAPERAPEPRAKRPAHAKRTTPRKPPAAAPGVLRVMVAPYGQIWLDGKAAGRAPGTLHVPPGTHTIAVGRGKQEKRRTVEVKPGQDETIRFVL